MSYFLEILCNIISWDNWIFTNNDESQYCHSLFYFWDIDEEADDIEVEDMVKQGLISKQDGDILKAHKKDILLDLQKILNDAEEFNRSKRESIKLIWKQMKKYGLSDDYIKKYIIVELYRLL